MKLPAENVREVTQFSFLPQFKATIYDNTYTVYYTHTPCLNIINTFFPPKTMYYLIHAQAYRYITSQ
jgi:hypothetical protein